MIPSALLKAQDKTGQSVELALTHMRAAGGAETLCFPLSAIASPERRD
jgi:hypothetical protein